MSSMDIRFRGQFLKTKVCKFFLEGRCRKGEACLHAHSQDEIRPMPDLSKTALCQESTNCKNSQCNFAHSLQELRATPSFYQTSVCLFDFKGKCRLGKNCRYLHMVDVEDEGVHTPDDSHAEEILAIIGELLGKVE